MVTQRMEYAQIRRKEENVKIILQFNFMNNQF